MTDKEKLEKLVAYLVRRMYAHNQMADIGSTGEIFDEKIENAKYEECRDALQFIDSIQEEPESLKPKITLGEATGKLKELLDNMKDSAAKDLGLSEEDYNKAIDECLYGKEPELVDDGDLPKEEPASEDLEQAIDTYLSTYFGGEKEKQDWPFLKKMAIHFAAWQKQQIIKNAVEKEVGIEEWGHLVVYVDDLDVKLGDKVKVIVIKED